MSLLQYTTTAPPTPTDVTAQFTNTTTVRVAWEWTSSGPAPNCFNTTTVTYHPEGGGESSLELSEASEAILTDLQCNTNYTITVVATAGEYRREGITSLPLLGKLNICGNIDLCHMMSFPSGPHSLSAAVLSPTSVRLTWVAPCNTQQYHIYYRGTCGAYINGTNLETDRVYVDESSLNTSHQEYTVDGIQEAINYTFTVNQSGFSGGRALSTGPVYARTFTTGRII